LGCTKLKCTQADSKCIQKGSKSGARNDWSQTNLKLKLGAGDEIRTRDFLLGKHSSESKMFTSSVNKFPNNPFGAFIETKKAQGISKCSLKIYQFVLSRALYSLGNPYTATSENIIAYLNTIPPNERGYSTRHVYRRVLRTFYGWLNETYDLLNPVLKVPTPQLPNMIMPTLRLYQIKAIIKDQNTKGKAVVMLATASGLRRTELANVKIEDIDWNHKRIKTLGKGRKEAYAPISFAEPFLKQWIVESGKTSGSLFNFNTFGLQTFFRRLEEKAGVKTNAHVFRRAFAVVGRELGLSDLTIKELGRWNSVDMVQRYTRDFSFDDANKQLNEKIGSLGTMFSDSLSA
jgi:site-specific recombinase XerD